MYKKPFYLTKAVGNNEFSYKKRKNKKLYIPSLIEIDDLNKIELGDEVVFEDYDFDGNFSSNKGLKNFYKIKRPHPNPLLRGEGIEQNIYLFDNHNHAFYFWYLARHEGTIGDSNTLIHIDEHADTRDNDKHLLKSDSEDLEKVFDFTNNVLNVGDYIIPAKEEGIIGEIIQLRNETNLKDYLISSSVDNHPLTPSFVRRGDKAVILNLDLDFFQPDLDFIDYELKKKVILDVAKKASVITVATSPFFINQKLAIKVFKDIFG